MSIKQFLKLNIFLCTICLSAQSVELAGFITDSTQNPLSNTNVIAVPLLNTDLRVQFSISSFKGEYKLKLEKNRTYLISISHLGYKKISDTLHIAVDEDRNYVMQEEFESLNEIVIENEMAVLVKEDTITYRVNQFKTGEERKLRDILKKLPGLEVDREGNVTVNGKDVTKLMVDGKDFFTGDEKLGVNNIPADAVLEIEALDNYTEIAFLKGLEESDKMALNIKLKKGKNKFTFGDVEVGSGIENRFLMHPKLFYYSPNTAVNIIGDFNNIGKKSFTIKDYINFEGGTALALDDKESFSKLYSDDFAQFLRQDEFVFNKNDFGAVSLYQELGGNFSLDAYSIFNKSKFTARTFEQFTYQTMPSQDEIRHQSNEKDFSFSINKIKLRYDNNDDIDIRANTNFKYNNAKSQDFITSELGNSNQFVNTNTRPKNVEFLQTFNFNKQFSHKHTLKLENKINIEDQTLGRLWRFNEPLFSSIIPLLNDGDEFRLNQINQKELVNISLKVKHYWLLGDFHHIYPLAGINYFNYNLRTLDEQILMDGGVNSFESAGFNNQLDFDLLKAEFGFQYKTQIGNLILKSRLMVQNNSWEIKQFGNELIKDDILILLPEFSAEYKFKPFEKLRFKYNRYTNFGNYSNYANRLSLQSFNRLQQGNENLQNQTHQTVRLIYSQINMFKRLFYNFGISHTHRENSIRSRTEIDGVDQISTSVFTDLPENTYNANMNVTKRITNYAFTVGGNANLSNYSRIINSNVLAYKNQRFGYNIKITSSFDKLPNLELGVKQNFSILKSELLENNFVTLSPFASLEYDWKDFIFKFDYEYNYFKNQTTDDSNLFEIAEASLFYGKESSAWSFEINATNLFNITNRRQSLVSEFIVTDRRTFIQPRIIIMKVIYKL